MSRPKASVPRTYLKLPPSSQKGGSNLSRSVWSIGEWGASSGAKTAIKTMVAMTRMQSHGVLRMLVHSGEPDAWIDIGIENVDAEIDAKDQDRFQDDHRLQQRKVAIDHGFVCEAAYPGPGEHGLRHDRAGNEIADEHSPERQHWNERIAQAMLPNHHGLAQPLDAGQFDVFAVEHLKHARPRQPHEARGKKCSERDHRQHVMLRSAHAAGREPAELHTEQEDQDDAEPEARRRYAEDGDRPRCAIEETPPIDRRNDAKRNADRHGEQQRPRNDGKSVGKAREENVHRWLAHAQRGAQITPERTADERHVLRKKRAVEA